MQRLAAGIAFVLAGVWGVSQACDCPRRTPESHFAAADLVFIGRAEEPQFGQSFTQRLAVLHTLKGKPGRSFTIVRAATTMSNCDRTYRAGEVDLVFVVKGQVDLCHGNYGLKWQWKQHQLAPLLRLAHGKPAPPTRPAFRAALVAALGPLLKGSTSVPVKYEPWTGKSLSIGRTIFDFTRLFPKSVVAVDKAVRHGALHYFSGIYHLQGYAFAVLLQQRGREQQVLYQVGEQRPPGRSSRGPEVPARLRP